jgi:hypothetical protein
MRRLPVFLLVASLAVFALPSFGTAQAPRGRSPALRPCSWPIVRSTRVNDEIDALTDKTDARSNVVAVARAR